MAGIINMGRSKLKPITKKELSEILETRSNYSKTRKAIEEAKQSNEHFAEVLENNGITVKIFLAAGGRKRRKRT